MDTWIALLRGPVFRISLAICLLGLAYRFGTTLRQIVAVHRRAGDHRLPAAAIVRSTFSWLLPLRVVRTNPLYGLISLVFHAGIILVPLFYVGHVNLWRTSLPIPWPTLGSGVSDVLTIAALLGLVAVLLMRLISAASRDLTTAEDVGILAVLLAAVLTGYWAAHPAGSPFAPRAVLVAHIALADLALVLTPLSKIVHCVLTPLTQLLSEVAWRFPADSGRNVAVTLGKENEPV